MSKYFIAFFLVVSGLILLTVPVPAMVAGLAGIAGIVGGLLMVMDK